MAILHLHVSLMAAYKCPCVLLPAGIYPFAGHEVARAFALTSTELSDCTDNLEGLGAMELDNLQEWEAKFNWKYPVVGKLIKPGKGSS
jgi:hypothetical protein